jgi:hypothetical protein
MVETPVYEWSVHIRDGALGRCTIRPTASGLFEIAGVRRLHPTLEGAVRAWAGPIVARAIEAGATRELPPLETPGPKP